MVRVNSPYPNVILWNMSNDFKNPEKIKITPKKAVKTFITLFIKFYFFNWPNIDCTQHAGFVATSLYIVTMLASELGACKLL